MVTDKYFGQLQIPTEVEGRTYYGCCEMCAAKLQSQRGMRYATDPVTGREVDKAKAVAGRLADGRIRMEEPKRDGQVRFRRRLTSCDLARFRTASGVNPSAIT